MTGQTLRRIRRDSPRCGDLWCHPPLSLGPQLTAGPIDDLAHGAHHIGAGPCRRPDPSLGNGHQSGREPLLPGAKITRGPASPYLAISAPMPFRPVGSMPNRTPVKNNRRSGRRRNKRNDDKTQAAAADLVKFMGAQFVAGWTRGRVDFVHDCSPRLIDVGASFETAPP